MVDKNNLQISAHLPIFVKKTYDVLLDYSMDLNDDRCLNNSFFNDTEGARNNSDTNIYLICIYGTPTQSFKYKTNLTHLVK